MKPNHNKRTGYYTTIDLAILLIYLIAACITSCERIDYRRIVILKTGTASEITANNSVIKATILDAGESPIIQHGHCWSTSEDPTIYTGEKTELGPRTEKGDFTSTVSGLTPNTKYYIKAYIINSDGDLYSTKTDFITDDGIITLTTTNLSNITQTSATSGGNITDDGGSIITARGVCWSTSLNPTVDDNITNDGAGNGGYISNLTGLTANETYYLRAYARNILGTAYGNEISFKTSPVERQILVVSDHDPGADIIIQKIIDRVNTIEGVKTEHMNCIEFMATTDFTPYDAALITENGSSPDMVAISNKQWPIPVVTLKAYMLYKGDFPLFESSGSTWLTTAKTTDLLPGITWMTVKNNQDIFAGYTIGDSIQWTGGYNTNASLWLGAGEAHIQAFNLSASHIPAIAANSIPLASNNYLVNTKSPLQTFMWKTEANTYSKRVVSWGVHHGFLEYATEDFYTILVNSVKWVLEN
ncbi:MAG: hypothetical protein JW973_11430 [Bacteroidales bacterium]|nr:hypothetical protein [Bacteroidales bacterium]